MLQRQRRIVGLAFIVILSTLCVIGLTSSHKAIGLAFGIAPKSKAQLDADKTRADSSANLTNKLDDHALGQRERIRVEQLTLWPTGFKPSEITRSAGPIGLIVTNNSRQPDISLQLNQERGNKLREVRLPAGKRDWQQYLDLPPGQYVITAVNHPEWTCRLNITPR